MPRGFPVRLVIVAALALLASLVLGSGATKATPVPGDGRNTFDVQPVDSGTVGIGDTFTVEVRVVDEGGGTEYAYHSLGLQLEWDAGAVAYVGDVPGWLLGYTLPSSVSSGDPPGTQQIVAGGTQGGLPTNAAGLVWWVTLQCVGPSTAPDQNGDTLPDTVLHLVSTAEDPLMGTWMGSEPIPLVLEDGFVTCIATPTPTATATPTPCPPEGCPTHTMTPTPSITPTPTATLTPCPSCKNTVAIVPADSGVVSIGESLSVEIHITEAELPHMAVHAQLEWDADGLELLSHSSAGSIVGLRDSPVVGSGDPPGTEQIRNMGGLGTGSPTGLVWTVGLRCDEEGTYALHLVPKSEDPLYETATYATEGGVHTRWCSRTARLSAGSLRPPLPLLPPPRPRRDGLSAA